MVRLSRTPSRCKPTDWLIRGKPKLMLVPGGLAPEHDAVICIGIHSWYAGLGVLSQSFMGHEIEHMWLDGRPAGEIGLAMAAPSECRWAVLTGDDRAYAVVTE
ncbi:D-aminopeptidase [Streptomyces sp. SceaMP-e96]|uniref:M55 family metallopeptidase n=1 Tax=unclassified Streptomyces TaxID=2593676 RepID=UPI0008239F3E|nr:MULTISPECIES: M55 family metallopeptidase [unclassified Streptomyces]MYT16572.1 hypothetical protein [Streptomyces sp. SID4951]SCK33566.1 D-aminopeptidase [Streptomyces sp. SceaMP-e96]